MGRKKKKPVKPWCWYCNREFDDDKILIQHQRAKHFKCPFCHKKLYSGPGLTVHCIQVHKEQLDKIPEALPNRNSVDIDIYGMQGVPEEDIREHERLKRGDDGPRSQDKSQSQSQVRNQPQALSQNQAMTSMHAAMFQRAIGMGAMPPPRFPLPPGMSPGMHLGMPPGIPPMLRPFMPPGAPFLPHPGFPQMPMQMMMPPQPPNMGFQSGMMQPNLGLGPLGFLPSTSGAIPPHPLSGAAHLIGVPPPGYPPPPPPPPPPQPSTEPSHQATNEQESISGQNLSTSKDEPKQGQDEYELNGNNRDSNKRKVGKLECQGDQQIEKLSKPHKDTQDEHKTLKSDFVSYPNNSALNVTGSHSSSTPTSNNTLTSTSQNIIESRDFIDLPNLKARIMHPNTDLSIEELRLSLTKYCDLIEKLSST